MTGRTIRRACAGVGAAAITALAGVSGASAQEPVNITFWSWVPGIEEQVEAFNASQTAIHVEYINKGNGNTEYAALRAALTAGADIPDAVQIEFQHLPSFIVRNELADLSQFGAHDLAAQFLPWTIAQVSQGEGIFAYPQDAGPMIMMCNQELLDTHAITAPTTWDEFQTAAAALHAADPNAYLANFTADQGHFFGLLWQSGAKPFTVDGTNITIDFMSPEVTRVAQLWDDLQASGNLAPIPTYSSDWNTALGNGTIACWTSGAWGPQVVAPAAPNLSGKWTAYQMPQWTAGEAINGNYGGSTIAVTAASQNQAAAETFNRWLNTDPAPTLELANGPAGLFPVTQATLTNPAWTDFTSDFFGGQKLHEVTAAAAEAVDVSFQWPPFTEFVYQTFADDVTQVAAGTSTLVATMADLQAKVTQYATDQGFTVVAP